MLSTITVSNTGDTGPGTLRAAIEQANADPAPETITFAPGLTGSITLSTSLPDLSTDMIIDGPGRSALTVARSSAAGTHAFRIFTVAAGSTVTISGLSITGGSPPAIAGRFSDGGGINNAGALTLTNCALMGNSANGNGGGVANSGNLTLVDTMISGNSSDFEGGGIFNNGKLIATSSSIIFNTCSTLGGGISNNAPGDLDITRSVISDNSAQGSPTRGGGGGGGIFNAGALIISSSTLSDNTAVGEFMFGGGVGGGIDNSSPPFGLTVVSSTVSGNKAVTVSANAVVGGIGGGIWCGNAPLTLKDSTVNGNSATASGTGGGIWSGDALLTVTNSTITGNSAATGGGIYCGNGSFSYATVSNNSARRGGGIALAGNANSVITAVDTLFANKQGGNVAFVPGSHGSFRSLGHNLFSDTPVIKLAPGDLSNIDPLLGPLADNGGPTMTQTLFPGSPAVDSGTPLAGVTTDQRGVLRPQRLAPDIGAFELQPAPIVLRIERFGVHWRPTILVVTFSSPMDAARAGSPANYRLVAAGADHPFGTSGDRVVPIRSVQFDPTSRSVRLTISRRLPLLEKFRLTVVGTPPGGLTDSQGNFLDGSGKSQPGSNHGALITGKLLVRPHRHRSTRRQTKPLGVGNNGTAPSRRVYSELSARLLHF